MVLNNDIINFINDAGVNIDDNNDGNNGGNDDGCGYFDKVYITSKDCIGKNITLKVRRDNLLYNFLPKEKADSFTEIARIIKKYDLKPNEEIKKGFVDFCNDIKSKIKDEDLLNKLYNGFNNEPSKDNYGFYMIDEDLFEELKIKINVNKNSRSISNQTTEKTTHTYKTTYTHDLESINKMYLTEVLCDKFTFIDLSEEENIYNFIISDVMNHYDNSIYKISDNENDEDKENKNDKDKYDENKDSENKVGYNIIFKLPCKDLFKERDKHHMHDKNKYRNAKYADVNTGKNSQFDTLYTKFKFVIRFNKYIKLNDDIKNGMIKKLKNINCEEYEFHKEKAMDYRDNTKYEFDVLTFIIKDKKYKRKEFSYIRYVLTCDEYIKYLSVDNSFGGPVTKHSETDKINLTNK